MKKLFVLCCLFFVGIAGWRIGERLSADALSMGLGVLFGVMAGLPVALLVMAAGKRRDSWGDEERSDMRQRQNAPHPYGYSLPQPQPPVIVLAGNAPANMPGQFGYPQSGYRALPPPVDHSADRQWRVVGGKEMEVDEY